MEFVCFFIDLGTNSTDSALHNTERLIFTTYVQSVYSAVRTESLYNRYVSSLTF